MLQLNEIWTIRAILKNNIWKNSKLFQKFRKIRWFKNLLNIVVLYWYYWIFISVKIGENATNGWNLHLLTKNYLEHKIRKEKFEKV